MQVMRFWSVLFLIFILVFPVRAHSAELSGDYLMHVCGMDAGGKELVKGGHTTCQAYIAGVVDYHNLIKSLDTAPSVDFCIPEGTSLYDLQVVVLRYLVLNRSQHGPFIAAPGVTLALYKSYPCKKGKR